MISLRATENDVDLNCCISITLRTEFFYNEPAIVSVHVDIDASCIFFSFIKFMHKSKGCMKWRTPNASIHPQY